jgi:hypothetical protein
MRRGNFFGFSSCSAAAGLLKLSDRITVWKSIYWQALLGLEGPDGVPGSAPEPARLRNP